MALRAGLHDQTGPGWQPDTSWLVPGRGSLAWPGTAMALQDALWRHCAAAGARIPRLERVEPSDFDRWRVGLVFGQRFLYG
jgi:hypothetical protein